MSGVFGVKPAWMAGTPCRCRACCELREVSLPRRVLYGGTVVCAIMLVCGGFVLLLALFVWAFTAIFQAV
jgi:hypothetical protein